MHAHSLSERNRERSGRAYAHSVGIAWWKFSGEREKVWNRHIDGGESGGFCSYIRRALISKSEGWCSHTVTTLHQTRSVTAKRAVRRLCSILQGVPLRYASRISDRSGLSYKSIPQLSFELSAPIRDVSRSQTSRPKGGGKHDKCTIAILR